VLNVWVADDSADINMSDPPIWEHVTPDADLVILGDAHGLVRAGTLRLPMWGSFTYCPQPKSGEAYPECEVSVISCVSPTHLLTITPK
jgi:hypothetical protein